jgi:2,4-dienoyl-CoA reductase-like NADH-dependent reductase (Old Yellow Enzyme family)/NADH dehydrogenase FAD-containing subunit
MKYPALFRPLGLGTLTLKNRLAMAQMTMNYATEEGFATEKLIRHYLERARGGVGLIFVEGTFFTAEGRGYRNQLGLASDEHAEKLKRLTEAVHGLENRAKIFIQIHHAGARASSKVTGLQPVAPSAIPPYPGAETPRALSKEEIKGLVEAHIRAAERAKKAGFDGVDIHCAHGYLVPGFFSSLSNLRTDEYGGDLSGRTRFLMEVIHGIKESLGEFPLTIKISGDEYIEGGLNIEKMTEIALLAQEAGIDGITLSAGTVGGKKIEDLSQAHKVLRTMPMMTEHGCLVPLAAEMKKSLKIPVITVGRINHPVLAEEIVAQGKADLVAMGRGLLADPNLPIKAFEGREEEIRSCIGCNEGCYKRILQQQEIQCSVNPTVGREGEISSDRVIRSKKVFVFGAGPAGLEAANAAHEKGHQVVVMEKEKELGGQLHLASIPPGRKEIDRFREFLLKRLKRAGVKVITGEEAIASFLRSERPDVLILAIGSKPKTFDIPGLDQSRILTAWEVLSGKKTPEEPCLVLGAGLVGCETADFLAEQGKKVVLVEVLPEMGTGADGDTKAYFNLRFQKHGVRVFTSTELHRVDGKTAILRRGNDETRIEIGTVVFAAGAVPENRVDEEFVSSVPLVIKVGDCVKPRNILESVREGFEAGRNI